VENVSRLLLKVSRGHTRMKFARIAAGRTNFAKFGRPYLWEAFVHLSRHSDEWQSSNWPIFRGWGLVGGEVVLKNFQH